MSNDRKDEPQSLDLKKLHDHQQVLENLILIYAVVQCKGIESASNAVGYNSPSAISNRIGRLEQFLDNQPIFVRGRSRTLELSPEGGRLFHLAESVVGELQAYINSRENPIEDLQGKEIRLATVTSVWATSQQKIKAIFENSKHGRIINHESVVALAHTDRIIQQVRSGEVDLGIVTYVPSSEALGPALEVKPWKEEDMVAVTSAHNPELKGRKRISLSALVELPMILLKNEFGLRKEFDAYLSQNKAVVKRIVQEFDQIAEIKDQIAGSADLVTVLPLPTVEKDPRLHALSVDKRMRKRPVSFLYRKDHFTIVKEFLECFPEEKPTRSRN